MADFVPVLSLFCLHELLTKQTRNVGSNFNFSLFISDLLAVVMNLNSA